jgi:hypothetical protein
VYKITPKNFIYALLNLILPMIPLMTALPSSAQAATPPAGLQQTNDRNSLRTVCATAVVVGLEWSPVWFATSYSISRNGTQIATTALPTYTDQAVAATTTYTYTVSAFGWSGKTLSTQSLTVTTAAASLNGDPAIVPARCSQG